MAGRWSWLGGYLLVIVVALVLGGLLGELAVFKQATLGKSKLTAADLVRFTSYAGSLYLVWLAGTRAGTQLQAEGGRFSVLSYLLPPLTTLLVVIGTYHTLHVVLRPFFSTAGRNMYNWLFVLAIALAALWLATALFHHAQTIIELFRTSSAPRLPAGRQCASCGTPVAANARFCPGCGKAL